MLSLVLGTSILTLSCRKWCINKGVKIFFEYHMSKILKQASKESL